MLLSLSVPSKCSNSATLLKYGSPAIVLVGVSVGVLVGVLVGVAVGVLVGVLVGVAVGVGVGVLVGVAVGVGVESKLDITLVAALLICCVFIELVNGVFIAVNICDE